MENTEDLREKIEKLAAIASNGEAKAKKSQGYDPSKNYKWTPESQFLLSGDEFGLVINSLRNILASPEAQRILLLEKAAKAIDNCLARAVDVGMAEEASKK